MPHPATEGGACMEKAMSYFYKTESPKGRRARLGREVSGLVELVSSEYETARHHVLNQRKAA
jgi:hypothetical protein